MNQSAKFWDKISARYAKQPVADEASYQKKLKVSRDYFKPEMEVLEIGCGTGSTAIVHAPYVKYIHAIDISSKMIEIARGKAEEEKIENVPFEQSTIDDLKIEVGSIDAVLALSLFHLVEDKDDVIKKVHSTLKPGGVFISSTVCMNDSMFKFLRPIVPIGMLFGFMPSVKFFTAKALGASLTAAGFEIEYRWLPKKGSALFLVARKAG